MIFDIFINIYIALMKMAIFVLPDWDLPQEVYYYMNESANTLYSLNFLLPVDTIFVLILTVLTFEIVLLTLRLIAGFLSILRGGGNMDI